MEIYLPIAEMPVNILLILALGAAVGFLSGMFGVGGGFLMTPFLIFTGIPHDVAVATPLSHIVASSVSGAMTHWRRKTIDFKMGGILIAGGLFGAVAGLLAFSAIRKAGQIDTVISVAYVLFLGIIGALMLNESIRAIRASRGGSPAPARRSGQHWWILGLPLKVRFRKSKLYISAIPPVVLGIFVGLLTAFLGVGGGFILVPAMIYILRMPANVVVGTSMFQILASASLTVFLHALNTQTVDPILAILLIIGGVFGVQFGVRFGQRLRGEQLRFLLAALVLGVALRLFIDLVIPPGQMDLYSLTVDLMR
jgi:uncharacterized membrane protein YfcA